MITQPSWVNQLSDKPFFDVREYGARGLGGVTDDTSGIQAALNAARDAGGGLVVIPGGTFNISSPLNMGNGNSSTHSKSVRMIGSGCGAVPELSSQPGITNLVWKKGSGSGYTMLNILGPIAGASLTDIRFICNGDAYPAETAFHAYHPYCSDIGRLQISGQTGYAFVIEGIVQTVMPANAQRNLVHDIVTGPGTGDFGSGALLGAATIGTGGSNGMSRNSFINLDLGYGLRGKGITLRFIDASYFYNPYLGRASGTPNGSIAWEIIQVGSAPGYKYPVGITVIGNASQNDSPGHTEIGGSFSDPDYEPGARFLNYINDGGMLCPVHNWAAVEGIMYGPPHTQVYNSTQQLIPSDSSYHVLSFNSEEIDRGSQHDSSANNSRMTARVAGWYHVIANITWADYNSTGSRRAKLRKNGTTDVSPTSTMGGSVADFPMLTIDRTIQLHSGDYLEVLVNQDSGSSLNVQLGNNGVTFSMTRLG